MKVTNNGNFTTIELETPSGQANYMGYMKANIPGDRRGWQRDPETQELTKYMADNAQCSQYVIKIGDMHTMLK